MIGVPPRLAEQRNARDQAKSALVSYVSRCGGSDTLTFNDATEARDAAHALRAQVDNSPMINITASYNRVRLQLRPEVAALEVKRED